MGRGIFARASTTLGRASTANAHSHLTDTVCNHNFVAGLRGRPGIRNALRSLKVNARRFGVGRQGKARLKWRVFSYGTPTVSANRAAGVFSRLARLITSPVPVTPRFYHLWPTTFVRTTTTKVHSRFRTRHEIMSLLRALVNWLPPVWFGTRNAYAIPVADTESLT